MKNGLVKTPNEIETLAEGGKLLHDILRRTAALVAAGVSTAELNRFAEAEIEKIAGRPAFKNYGPKKNPFPAGLCTSINDVVVHGIPSEEAVLREGDIVSLDIGMEYKGLYTDTAITIGVGATSSFAQKIMNVTKKSLDAGIRQAKPGNRVGHISSAIQRTVEAEGFSVVRDLVGHGVGYAVHEDPQVPCYGRGNQGPVLVPGMVLAIEPMVCAGTYRLLFDSDGWTIRTEDGKLAAHFEHTIAITEKGSRILT